MTNCFSIEDLKKFIDIYIYPVIVVDKKSSLILANKVFKRIEKSDEILLKDKILNILTSKEYIISNKKGKSFFSLKFSNFTISEEEYTIISFFDITAKKKLLSSIIEKQNLFNSLTEQLPEGIVLFNENIIYTNNTFVQLLGYTQKELHQKVFLDIFESSEVELLKEILEQLSQSRKTKIETSLKLFKKNKTLIWVRIVIKRIKQNDNNLFLAVVTDISKEIKHLNELSQLANYDKLTGIYNRRKLDELLNTEYKITKRYDRSLSALFFDIDHFKKVNDTYGHDIGDIVLSNLAELISSQIRETDIFARWGGEEFIILLPETTVEKAILIANEIMISLSTYHFPEVGKITLSIGISSLKKERLQTFTKRLDNALYKAKEEGRNRYIVF